MFGWRSPSNIIYNDKDKYYYVTATTAPYGLQLGGTTMMRTRDLSRPNSWKCWNGTSQQFDVEIGVCIELGALSRAPSSQRLVIFYSFVISC